MVLKIYKWLFVALLAVYAGLAFGLPANPETLQRFNVTETRLRFLNASVVLPLIAIYLTALYGIVRFYRYAHKVRDTKEGPNLVLIAKGLMVLGLNLPVSSIVGSLRNYVRFEMPQWANEVTITRNYITLLFALVSVYFIARGIEGLYKTLQKKQSSAIPFYGFILPISLASVFTWLNTSSSSTGANGYSLPDGLLIATIVIPYTYVWSVGIRAVVQLYEYQKTVRGSLYRAILKDISFGIGLLMIISVLIQLLTTLNSQFERLRLTPLLAIVYFLLILYAIGYGFVARGAKNLHKMEEV